MLNVDQARAKDIAILLAYIGLGISAPATANAGTSAGQSFSLVGEVPIMCRATVRPQAVPSAGSNTFSGELNEFCNSPGGYAVYARLGGASDQATLLVDGQTISPGAGGEFVVTRSSQPNVAARTLQLSGVTSTTTIMFQIVPL